MKHTIALITAGILTAAAAFAAEVDLSKLPPAAAKQGLTFEKDIHPLFEASCVRCHSGDRPKGGLRLDTLENSLKGTREGKVIIPGESTKSALVIAISQIDPKSAMPPRQQQRRGRPNAPGAPGAPAQNAGGANPPPAGGQQAPATPPPKPLTAEQVGLVRAWIDQGAK
jgi:hypothetical protein